MRFKVPIGLSDHTADSLSAVVAASLGAVMIEKHFTIDRKLPGVDQKISMEPSELAALKKATLEVQTILGDGRKKSTKLRRVCERIRSAQFNCSDRHRITNEF